MYKAAIGLGIALSLAGCNTTDLQGIQHALSSKPTEIALTPNRYWAGQAYQPRSRSKTWTIEGYIVPRRASRMTYPSLGCAAEWAFKAGDPAGKLTYREEIYHDPKNTCVKSLDVSVKAIDATTVEYKSYNPDGSVSATGQLKPAPVPVPFNLEGDWSGFAKNAKGRRRKSRFACVEMSSPFHISSRMDALPNSITTQSCAARLVWMSKQGYQKCLASPVITVAL